LKTYKSLQQYIMICLYMNMNSGVRNNIFLGLLVFCIKCIIIIIIIIIICTHVFLWEFRCLKGIKVQQRSLYFVPPSLWYCPRHYNINCKIPPGAIQPKYIEKGLRLLMIMASASQPDKVVWDKKKIIYDIVSNKT
jgi:hypothetical protein